MTCRSFAGTVLVEVARSCATQLDAGDIVLEGRRKVEACGLRERLVDTLAREVWPSGHMDRC